MPVTTAALIVLLTLSAQTLSPGAEPPPFSAFLLDEARELALARSAAPPSVTDRAGFYVLRADGRYERVRASGNGFNCLVQRSFTVPTTMPDEFYEPRVLAPICFNAEASASVMQRDFFLAPLVKRGIALSEIRTKEQEAYRSGALRYPTRTTIAYMFSSAHWLGPNVQHWHPHVMIWAPGLEPTDVVPADVASFGVASGFPVLDRRWGPNQMLLVIPAARAIDPAGSEPLVPDGKGGPRGSHEGRSVGLYLGHGTSSLVRAR